VISFANGVYSIALARGGTVQWQADGLSLNGKTGLSYSRVVGDTGKIITAVETASGVSLTSNALFDGGASATPIVLWDFGEVSPNGTTLNGATKGGQTWVGNSAPLLYFQDGQLWLASAASGADGSGYAFSDPTVQQIFVKTRGSSPLRNKNFIAFAQATYWQSGIQFNVDHNGSVVLRRGDTEAILFSSSNYAMPAGGEIDLKREIVAGITYIQLRIDGVHMTASLNGGLGVNATGLPLGTYFGLRAFGDASAQALFDEIRTYPSAGAVPSITAISAVVSNTTTAAQRLSISGVYPGTPSGLRLAVRGQDGSMLTGWRAVAVSGGTFTAMLTNEIPASAQLQNLTVILEDPNTPELYTTAMIKLPFVPVLRTAQVGMNSSFWDGWGAEFPRPDLTKRLPVSSWVKDNGENVPIANRNLKTLNPISIPAGSSHVTHKVLENGNMAPVMAGVYDYIYPITPGMTVIGIATDGVSGIDTSVPGRIRCTVTAASDGSTSGTFAVRYSGTMPTGEWEPTCIRVEDVSISTLYSPRYAADADAMNFGWMRWMNSMGVNDGNYLQLPISSIEHISDVRGCSLAFQVQLCNAIGADLWLTLPWRTPDSVIELVENYLVANMAAGRKWGIQVGNENWNPPFVSYHQRMADGVAIGLWNTAGNATPKAVRNMILEPNALSYATGVTTFNVTVNAGTRVYIGVYGSGSVVLDVTSTINQGDTVGPTGSAKATLVSNNEDTWKAGLRLESRRVRLIAQRLATKCALAGKPGAGVAILGGWAAGAPADTITMLEWEDLLLQDVSVAGAPYWGTDFGNPSMTSSGFTPAQKALYNTDQARWLDWLTHHGTTSVDERLAIWASHKETVLTHIATVHGSAAAQRIRFSIYEGGAESYLTYTNDPGGSPGWIAMSNAYRALRRDPRYALDTKYWLAKAMNEFGDVIMLFDWIQSDYWNGTAFFGMQFMQGDLTAPPIAKMKELMDDVASNITRFDLIAPSRTGIGSARVIRTGKVNSVSSVSWAHTGGGSGTLTFQPGELIKTITFTNAVGTLSLSNPSAGIMGVASQVISS
jgi:hypothetical protein